MYPLYKKDINSGKLTKSDALELLTCLWIKTLTVQKICLQAHTLSSAGSPMYQNVTVGRQTVDKKDAVNELSFVVFQSIAQTRLTQPNFTVCYHKNIDKKFMEECIEVVNYPNRGFQRRSVWARLLRLYPVVIHIRLHFS